MSSISFYSSAFNYNDTSEGFVVRKRKAGRTEVPYETLKKSLSFKIELHLPKLLATEIKSTSKVKVVSSPVKISHPYDSVKLMNASALHYAVAGMLHSKSIDEGYTVFLYNKLQKPMKDTVEDLKIAFKRTFDVGTSTWEAVSNERLARRAALHALGVPGQLKYTKQTYTTQVFRSAIDSFSSRVRTYEKRAVTKVEFFAPLSSSAHRHPDFAGYKSRYLGPDEVRMSILGLNIVNHFGTAGSRKMIVPIGLSPSKIFYNKLRVDPKKPWKRWDALIIPSAGGAVFEYPIKPPDWNKDKRDFSWAGDESETATRWGWETVAGAEGKKTARRVETDVIEEEDFERRSSSASGVPIIFQKGINAQPVYFQDPVDPKGRRPVFWAYDKSSGRIYFPPLVRSTLIKHGVLSSKYR